MDNNKVGEEVKNVEGRLVGAVGDDNKLRSNKMIKLVKNVMVVVVLCLCFTLNLNIVFQESQIKDKHQGKITPEDLAIYYNLGNNKLHIKLKEDLTDEQKNKVISEIKSIGKDFHSVCEDKDLFSMLYFHNIKDYSQEQKNKFFKEKLGMDCNIDYIFEYDSSYELTKNVNKLVKIVDNISNEKDISAVYKKEREAYEKKLKSITAIKDDIELKGRIFLKMMNIRDYFLEKDIKWIGIYINWKVNSDIKNLNNIISKEYCLSLTKESEKKLKSYTASAKSIFPLVLEYTVTCKEKVQNIITKVIKDSNIYDSISVIGSAIEYNEQDCRKFQMVLKVVNLMFNQLDVNDNNKNAEEVFRRQVQQMKRAYNYSYLMGRNLTKRLFPSLDLSLQPANDPYFRFQWYLNAMDVPVAWRITQGNSSHASIVLDNGADYNHPDLKDQQNRTLAYDVVYDDNDPQDGCGGLETDVCLPPDESCVYHGVQITGVMHAKSNNNIGISGIVPANKTIPFRISDSVRIINKISAEWEKPTELSILCMSPQKDPDLDLSCAASSVLFLFVNKAIEKMIDIFQNKPTDPSPKVALLAFGPLPPFGCADSPLFINLIVIDYVEKALQFFRDNNIAVVVTSGNQKCVGNICEMCTTSFWTRFKDKYSNILVVGASDFFNRVANYSYGGVDVLAPGGGGLDSCVGEIATTTMTGFPFDRGVDCQDVRGTIKMDKGYTLTKGTSLSAANAAGVLQLVMTRISSPHDAIDIIGLSARPIPCESEDEKSLLPTFCGFGIVNAGRALTIAELASTFGINYKEIPIPQLFLPDKLQRKNGILYYRSLLYGGVESDLRLIN